MFLVIIVVDLIAFLISEPLETAAAKLDLWYY